ncbi:MAG: type IV toxin-antitoxin system AbiEi family antitoxin domain-containing protein [Candidatus Heimdallarchaeota archaeon]
MQDDYINSKIPGGISRDNRRRLDLLNRKQREPFKISDAVDILGISYTKASRLLAYWASRGWLARVRKGLYITVPLGTINPAERKEDPWVIAARVFEPCYIGGWSACEHWGLTEQIFNDIVVLTSRNVRERKIHIQDTLYVIKVVQQEKLFGTNIVWRQQTKVKVSDPSRTLIDILDDPSIGGGMRHIAEVVKQYFEGGHRDEAKLLEYVKRMNNRTVYKRLGHIIETLNLKFPNIIETCRLNLSKGYSTFDPTVSAKGRFSRRWNLRINVTIE